MGVILYPPTIDWSWMKQRPQHLMDQFAQHGHSVFYFNKTGTAGKPVYERVAPNLYLVHHAEYFIKNLWPRMRPGQGTVYWTSWSRQLPRGKSIYGSDYVVYDCVDDFPDWESDERNHIHNADAVVCTADGLQAKMAVLAPSKPVIQVPNGCDWDYFRRTMFRNRSVPLPGVPNRRGPKIGYIGAWAPWVDERIIQKLGEQIPHAEVVIVGPKLREDTAAYPANVHFLGYQDYSKLPGILPHLNVCIIPFHVNRITQSTNPIKVYEYLAAGKPVVSTDLPEVRKMVPHVAIAGDPDDFVRQVQSLLASPDRLQEQRSRYAKMFSWRNRYLHIQHHLSQWYPVFMDKSQPVSLVPAPRIHEIPLAHQTVNSYYRDTTFLHEPSWVGCMPAGEYRFLVKLDPGIIPASAEAVHLEFDAACRAEDGIQVDIGVSAENWAPETLSFASRPSFAAMGSMRAEDRLQETFSFDVTSYARQSGAVTFELSSPQQVVTTLGRPRLTCFVPPTTEGGDRP
ncbi:MULTISPECIES: glycosyltransferase [Paenibacillus]|uniref:glycosyltransferase n=1 Tax=Paenibacillus TaxID=44249 RepID=UPI0022B8A411|nr:glycosyltransferase [Paenibacillus caseinilyticus]MCZ8518556.1 glycosyltransferase [Paenibacillus caseinilyticus]